MLSVLERKKTSYNQINTVCSHSECFIGVVSKKVSAWQIHVVQSTSEFYQTLTFVVIYLYFESVR